MRSYSEVIQGKWEDLITRQDLRGRQVRIIVLDEQPADDPWLKSLRAWVDSHPPIQHSIDDSRESIYGETLDDSRKDQQISFKEPPP